MSKIYLSVVIPAYNEQKNLKKGVLDQVWNYLKSVDYSWEVIVVDDGSTDDTRKILKRLQNSKLATPKVRLIENRHGGKAWTVMTGLLAAKGEIALFTDMDQATPIGEVEKLLPKFNEGLPAGRQGYDIVIGSRHGRTGAPFLRKLMAYGFAFLRNIILGLPFRDTQCGFKAFNQKAIKKIIPKIKDEWGILHTKGGAVNAGFDVEVLYLAKKLGFKIAEVDVQWKYVGSERVQFVKDAAAAIYDMLRIRWNDLVGKY